ncbi:MAG: hypothetical protein R3A52_13285 [Polyangiales bacterium]
MRRPLALALTLSLGCVHDWDSIRAPGAPRDAGARADTGRSPDAGTPLDVPTFDIPTFDIPPVDVPLLDLPTVDFGGPTDDTPAPTDTPSMTDAPSDRPVESCRTVATLLPDAEAVARATTPGTHVTASVLTVSNADEQVMLLRFTPGDRTGFTAVNRVTLTLTKATSGCTGACPQSAGALAAFLLSQPDFDPGTVTWAQRRPGAAWMIGSGEGGRGADVLGVGTVTETSTTVTITMFGASADPLVRAAINGPAGILLEGQPGAFTAQSRAAAGDATAPTRVFQECLGP